MGHEIDIRHPENNTENLKELYCWSAFNDILVEKFKKFGEVVANYPAYFIIFPTLISLTLSTGLYRIQYLDDPIELFSPEDSPFLQERALIRNYFKTNYTHAYSPTRSTDFVGYTQLIVTASDGGSILRKEIWKEIVNLNKMIYNITIVENKMAYSYEDICAQIDGSCLDNPVLNIAEVIESLQKKLLTLTWPITIHPYVPPQYLGGMTIEDSGVISDVKAIFLAYFERIEPQHMRARSIKWEMAVSEFLKETPYTHIKVSKFFAFRSIQDELANMLNSAIPFMPITGIFMIVTCMTLLWMEDCVRSKPFIGFVGIISATMASAAGFGTLMYLNQAYSRMNVIVVFLVLGIGVDDIFVALSAWRKTKQEDSVQTRISQTYEEAILSITITSLTNFLSFAVGATTPVAAVQSFCLYAAVTIVFAYIWFITFCGAFLALAGQMENERRHSLFFVKVKSQKSPKQSCFIRKWFFNSPLVEKDINLTIEMKDHWISVFFRDQIGDLLCNPYFRGFAWISLIIYLGGAIYGCSTLKVGLYRERMSRDDSYISEFHKYNDMYFRKLPYRVQVIITGNVTYSDPETQEDLLDLIKSYENSMCGTNSLFSDMWLKEFLARFRIDDNWKKKIVDEKSFIRVLREEYLPNSATEQTSDISFNEDFTRIKAIRFIIQASDVSSIYDDVKMMDLFRKIGSESKFNVTVFHTLFSLFDQHHIMKPLAIQSIVIAALMVMVVSLLFIHNITGAVAIAFSVIFIAVGVLGYMSFWNVNLDQVSVASIFMCIGFSVDFSAHITYSYLFCHEKTSEGRIRSSLFGLGLPIMQGGITTLVSLAPLLFIPAYSYRTFFKTIFLVTIFSMYFSIVLIPLLLASLEWLRSLSEKMKPEAVSGISYKRNMGSLRMSNFIPPDIIASQTNQLFSYSNSKTNLGNTNHSYVE